MSQSPMLDSIETERRRRFESRESEGANSEKQLTETLLPFAGTPFYSRVWSSFQYAKGIEYAHHGLSPAGYLAHPISVACMSIKLLSPPDVDATTLALLHNVLEVSTLGSARLQSDFGAMFATAISVLTVDRAETSREYTQSYYERVRALPRWARIVKVLDKLDNLFVLCINPDDRIRSTYLDDIEEFIFPMAERDLGHMLPYLTSLVADCRAVGYLSPESRSKYLQEKG